MPSCRPCPGPPARAADAKPPWLGLEQPHNGCLIRIKPLETNRCAHRFERRLEAGTEPKRRRTLAHEPLEPVDDDAAGGACGGHEGGLGLAVGELDDRLAGMG